MKQTKSTISLLYSTQHYNAILARTCVKDKMFLKRLKEYNYKHKVNKEFINAKIL